MSNMTKEDREALKIMGNISKNVQNKQWTCMCDGCNETSINSHLLMRNGILNYVAEDNHLYELRCDPPEAFQKDKLPVEFRKVGIKQAISFPLFCNHHDTSLFKEIEDGSVDYSIYRHIALYCYRAICAEIRKKEIAVENFKRFSQSSTLWGLLGDNAIQRFKWTSESYQYGIEDMQFYCGELKKDIEKATESFEFFTRELPITGIYASTTSTILASEEETVLSPILNAFFFHLIPMEAKTMLVIGYHKEHVNEKILNYILRWKDASIEEMGVMLTALFTQVETWGMSPSIYAQLTKENTITYFAKVKEALNNVDQTPIEDLNLFEGILKEQ